MRKMLLKLTTITQLLSLLIVGVSTSRSSGFDADFAAKVRKSMDGRINKMVTDGQLHGFCNPKTIVSYPPIPCRDLYSECQAGKCACRTGFEAKYVFLQDRYGCFVKNGELCKHSLFVHNFGPQLEGPEMSVLIEKWERQVQHILDTDEKVDNKTAEQVRGHLRSWTTQVDITFRPVDWGCVSGVCDPKKRVCGEGRNPVLMDKEADVLPVLREHVNVGNGTNTNTATGGYQHQLEVYSDYGLYLAIIWLAVSLL